MKRPAASIFSFGQSEQAKKTVSPFSFGNSEASKQTNKTDGALSFSTTLNTPATSSMPPPSTTPSIFSFSDSNPSKVKAGGIFSFGQSTSSSTASSTGIFGNVAGTDSSSKSAIAPRRADTAPTTPFQFSGSAIPSSGPQKSFSFGQSSTSQPFKVDSTPTNTGDITKTNSTHFGSIKPSFGSALENQA